MKIINVLFILLIFGTSAAYSGELDRHYLELFGESVSEPYNSAMKTALSPASQKCRMPLHHDLKRDWKQLEESTQKTLAKYLGKPSLTGEAIFQSNGGHFQIHYATSGADAPPATDSNNNKIPDWIESVGDAFEAAYNREINVLGYRVPPGMPCHVYLQNITFFGLTETDILTDQSATSYITIENDFAEQAFQNSIPGNDSANVKSLKALQITAAHEFHHVIQFGYNVYFSPGMQKQPRPGWKMRFMIPSTSFTIMQDPTWQPLLVPETALQQALTSEMAIAAGFSTDISTNSSTRLT